MTLSTRSFLTLSLAATVVLTAVPAFGAPFTLIRIGDVDGFGYGTGAGLFAANGGPANVLTGGVLGAEGGNSGDFLPDLNRAGGTLTGDGDDFDSRSAAEIAGAYTEGQGFVDNGSLGSQFTDISLSTSYATSSGAGQVYDANTSTYGAGGPFPAPPPTTLSNQPGFIFNFSVAGADINSGTPIFFNMLFGDYDVVPASVLFTRANGSTFSQAVTTQSGAADGLIQATFATLAFGDVFTANGANWDGFLMVDFQAPNEPYTAFDFVELSVTPIQPNTIPEPTTMLLLGSGLAAAGLRRRMKKR